MRPAWVASTLPRMSIDPFAPIPAHAAALRAGEYSAVELAEFFLDRLERFGPRLNAVVTLTRERALREAKAADAELARGVDRGPLHGIPYGVKDLLAAEGYPTTWGCAPLRDQQFPSDSTVVAKLTAAGAVLCAKLAMVEWAGGLGYDQPDAAFTGPGICAWDESRWSGGSSSGSGSAVGAGLVRSPWVRRRGGASTVPPTTTASAGCGRRSGGSTGRGAWS